VTPQLQPPTKPFSPQHFASTPFARPSSSHQFASTPKFAQPRRDVPIRSPTRPKPAIAPLVHRKSIDEAIEDASQEEIHNDHEQEEDEMIFDSVERHHEQKDDEESCHDYPPSPKRRRLSLSEHTTPRRFVFSSHGVASPSIAASTQNIGPIVPHTNRPHFIKPTSVPVDSAEPLPEAFSPHRRGQKFVPGGLASEVRQWVFDTAQTNTITHAHTRRPAGSAGGGNIWHVHVSESKGCVEDGIVLVRGSVEGREIKLILPSVVKKTDAGGKDVGVGVVIGLRDLTWEVEIKGEIWVVAVDWRIMNG